MGEPYRAIPVRKPGTTTPALRKVLKPDLGLPNRREVVGRRHGKNLGSGRDGPPFSAPHTRMPAGHPKGPTPPIRITVALEPDQ
jgi:hypothetical protein